VEEKEGSRPLDWHRMLINRRADVTSEMIIRPNPESLPWGWS